MPSLATYLVSPPKWTPPTPSPLKNYFENYKVPLPHSSAGEGHDAENQI